MIDQTSVVTEPLISVIIPFLNPGYWLVEAIESVLHQTYVNWELILVDDGSKKEDSEIALAYSEKFLEKIIYIEHDGHENKGLTASRNTGIAKAHGDLIAFLDADDCWLPEKLFNQLTILKQFPQVQMICEASIFWFSWKHPDEKNHVQLIGADAGVYKPPQLMELLYPLGEGQPPCPSGIMITKQALKRAGGFEKDFSGIYQLYEDQAFLSKVYAQEIIYISCEANNMYRKRNDSMSSAAKNEGLYKSVRLFYLEWMENYFLKSSSINPEIEKLINNFRQKIQN